MCDVCIQLKRENAIVTTVDGEEVIDWIPAYKAAALEIQQLNGALVASGLDPIEVNPDAVKWVAEHTEVIPEHTEVIDGEIVTIPEQTVTVPAGYVGQLESFIGTYCSPVSTYVGPLGTDEGIVTVRTMNYSFIKSSQLFAFGMPQNFDLLFDRPSTAGTIQ